MFWQQCEGWKVHALDYKEGKTTRNQYAAFDKALLLR